MKIAPRRVLTSVAEYAGEAKVAIAATQLESPTFTSTQARRALAEWIEFFGRPTPIRHLELASRVPQNLLDSVAGQADLESLKVKWGPYADIRPLSRLTGLTELVLGGAARVVDLGPLTFLTRLTHLVVDGAFGAAPEPLSAMTWLRELSFGNRYPGSDRMVKIKDFEWVRPLVRLRRLDLIGVAASDPDLSVLLDLPELEHFGLSMRRDYRSQVRELASQSRLFATVEADFASRERYTQTVRANARQ